MEPGDVFSTIRPTLAQILRVEAESIQPGASLSEDLGAESIDLAEIEIVLEETFPIRASEETIAAYLMGELTAPEFYDKERNITPTGMQRLGAVIPGFDGRKWSQGDLNMYNLWHVLTVDSLCRYVCDSISHPPPQLSR